MNFFLVYITYPLLLTFQESDLYIYIQRERQRQRETETEGDRDRDRETDRDAETGAKTYIHIYAVPKAHSQF